MRLRTFHSNDELWYHLRVLPTRGVLDAIAGGMVTRQWKVLGARSPGGARSFIVNSVRRRLGLTMSRELARHRRNRAPLIGVPGDALGPMARYMRGQWRRYGSPSDPPERDPTIITEEYYAFQAHAPTLAFA